MPALNLEAFSLRFQASPNYVLRPLAELTPLDRGSFGELERDGGFSAILQPRSADGMSTLKAIDDHTVRLVKRLSIPRHLSRVEDIGHRAEVARLVLDGVIEMETSRGFVSGPSAHRLLFASNDSPATGVIARLSHAALRYGATLSVFDRRRLARRLYSYNVVPMRPAASDLDGALEDGSILGGGAAALLRRRYTMQVVGGWTSWRQQDRSNDGLVYKLYVSPHADDHLAVLRCVIEAFSRSGVPAFKVGRGHLGIVRPDKIVAYFTARSAVETMAEQLGPGLGAFRAQGVPFSSELTSDGMLSWGVDPPLQAGLLPWRGLESWRLSICNELASSLVTARAAGLARADSIRFATDRISLEGVDPMSWTPVQLGEEAG